MFPFPPPIHLSIIPASHAGILRGQEQVFDKNLIRQDAWTVSMKRGCMRSYLGPHCQRQEGAIEGFWASEGHGPVSAVEQSLCCVEREAMNSDCDEARDSFVGMVWKLKKAGFFCSRLVCVTCQALYCLSAFAQVAFPAWNTSWYCHKTDSVSSFWSYTEKPSLTYLDSSPLLFSMKATSSSSLLITVYDHILVVPFRGQGPYLLYSPMFYWLSSCVLDIKQAINKYLLNACLNYLINGMPT